MKFFKLQEIKEVPETLKTVYVKIEAYLLCMKGIPIGIEEPTVKIDEANSEIYIVACI